MFLLGGYHYPMNRKTDSQQCYGYNVKYNRISSRQIDMNQYIDW